MQLPIKAHYAAVAMLALAKQHASGNLTSARAIADEQGVPQQFLVQILQQLRASGLVTSIRGANGGFRLALAPHQISLADVVYAVTPAATGEVPQAGSAGGTLHEVWQELAAVQTQFLARTTLQDLVERDVSSASMFYI
jgi:Rrf2 family protein